MMNMDALSIPDAAVCHKTVFLRKRVLAIQLAAVKHGGTKLGPLSHLGTGATLELCGDGFNERTLKVRMDGQYYFVLAQDIESA
jgi:hypothetical protein